MDVEATCKDVVHEQAAPGRGRAARWLLVALNCGMLMVGTTGGPLISRLYFSKGGHRQWLSAWLETAGWPLLLDRPAGVTNGKYWMGFFLIIGAAALYGLILPLVELAYKHVAARGRAVTYALVMEMQLVMGFFATAFCTVGMVVNKDFQEYFLIAPLYVDH
ncbi:hypothetical protein OsJ_29689 [Oryza sativa Japonica Group]|uniref:Uncharacterized protein n=1 Tax=Oryza sativa subsp. japonica TaxID=39947 RepID=B9G426_ORYSJ|nr:hypothetical protein OsJ_29689 [Oryza sativa Japonica Group]